MYNVISAMSSWVPKDTLFQALQWQNSLKVVGKYYYVSDTRYYPYIHNAQFQVEGYFEPNRSTGIYSVDLNIESFVELLAYDTE